MARVPRVVVVSGPPCAGKSTIAGRLSAALGAPHLQMDWFREQILPDSDQRVEHRDIAYRAMHVAAEVVVNCTAMVIVDATYTAAPCRRDLVRRIERSSGDLAIVECHVDAAVARQRLAGRGAHPAVDLTPERASRLAAGYRYFDGAYAVWPGRGDESLEGLLEYVRRHEPDAREREAWCRAGQPRERAQRASRAAAALSV
jgi:predicted kinase